jgi:hemerythrin
MVMTAARFVHYVIGHELIDNEHRALFNMVNEAIRLAKALQITELKDQIFVIQAALAEHFHYEEQLMQEARYPYLEAHKQSHIMLQATMSSFVAKMKDMTFISYYFSTELEELFIQHIDYADRQFEDFIGKIVKN